MWPQWVNTLRPGQNGRHFPDDIFKWIFLNENVWILINISLKFVPKGPINNIPTLVRVMAWRRPGNKPSSEPMMIRLLTHTYVSSMTHICGLNELMEKTCYSSALAMDLHGNIEHGQHWFRQWLGAWWHQAITLTNVDLPSLKSSDNHLRAVSLKIPQPSLKISNISFKYPWGKKQGCWLNLVTQSLPAAKELKSVTSPREQWVNPSISCLLFPVTPTQSAAPVARTLPPASCVKLDQPSPVMPTTTARILFFLSDTCFKHCSMTTSRNCREISGIKSQ